MSHMAELQAEPGGVIQEVPEIIVHPSKEPPHKIPEKMKKSVQAPRISFKSENEQVFIELLQLDSSGLYWQEKARWIRYEENVEPSGNWGRPFLSYIDCESLRHLRHTVEQGLVSLGSVSDGGFTISYTISNMLVLGGHAEARHRVRLRQIMTLPRMHQGESQSRFRKKVHYRRKFLRIFLEKREQMFARAWEMSDNEVRNRWVRLARMALDQHRKQNPNPVKVRAEEVAREWCPEKYLFDENGAMRVNSTSTSTRNLLKTETHADRLSVASEFSNVSYLINMDYETTRERGLPMTSDQIKLKKILHPNTKGILILHAPVDFLKRDEFISAFVRYPNDKPIVDSLELNLPVKFMFILFSSKHAVRTDGYQMCRTMGTLFHDKAFRRCAYEAKTCQDITKAFFTFIDGSVMLPPGDWRPDLLTPIAEAISGITRKKNALRKFKHRDGKQLWRIVRTKIRVIAMMKNMVQSKHALLENNDDHIEKEHEVSSTQGLFPRRGDCPLMNKFCAIRRRITRKHCSKRKKKVDESLSDSNSSSSESEEIEKIEVHPLHPDGRWFGGLRREITKRYPIYVSDIKDGLHIQCLATILYLAISLIAMCLTYGQVISKYTKGYIGASEMLFGTAISCVLMAALGTEPLAVIAGTAAMMIFESSTYQVSSSMKLDFMQVRWLTGMWIFLFLIIILAFDKAHWIHYCTRFTEEILHVLVALLFMYEGIKNLIKVYEKHPLREEYVINANVSGGFTADKPNTALLYTIIMFATFGLALGFRLFEKTRFFSPRVRRLLNFFSIPVAVNVMNGIVYAVDVYLNTIHIPERLKLTSPDKRGRFVLPDGDKMFQGSISYWIIPISIAPAVLTVILLFIESEVTLLDCFKETRGRKGSGFHTNLLVVAIMVLISSFLGLPWMCLAAVETSVHLDSLKVWSSFDAPGVKSHVVKIREQRLTLFFTGILIGLSSFLSFYLDQIPEAVLSGVVLYMGVVALFGVQMIERFFLMFMAPGQHPDIPYLKNVPLSKVYLFTIIQVGCVVILWIVKSIKDVAAIFPLVVLLMIPLRALLGRVFSIEHIEQLDNEEDEEGHGPLD
ncbi:band 3 anion transport protein-like isoform X2 [Dendronephthya gigantea]|nr:band 3 anion transport protein-like isoform X2 [Dendronephthya gigantea]